MRPARRLEAMIVVHVEIDDMRRIDVRRNLLAGQSSMRVHHLLPSCRAITRPGRLHFPLSTRLSTIHGQADPSAAQVPIAASDALRDPPPGLWTLITRPTDDVPVLLQPPRLPRLAACLGGGDRPAPAAARRHSSLTAGASGRCG